MTIACTLNNTKMPLLSLCNKTKVCNLGKYNGMLVHVLSNEIVTFFIMRKVSLELLLIAHIMKNWE